MLDVLLDQLNMDTNSSKINSCQQCRRKCRVHIIEFMDENQNIVREKVCSKECAKLKSKYFSTIQPERVSTSKTSWMKLVGNTVKLIGKN